MEDANFWNCSATKGEGEKYFIEKLNIWDYEWNNTGEYFINEKAENQWNKKIIIYQITDNERIVKFGAIERSANVWIIYTNYYQSVE